MAELSKYTKELSKLFSESENILLICHINPDGDAIGSQLALYQYLVARGRKAEMISPNNLQEFLKWMPDSGLINVFTRNRQHCRNLIEGSDLIVLLDFNQPDRLGEAQDPVMASSAKKIIIDHHLNPVDFNDLVISDPSKCSTAELVYELIALINGGPFITRHFAEVIYVGIITDTGNFEHGAYTARTLKIVADLIDAGIEKEKILSLIYHNFSVQRMKLLGFALNERMVILPEYKTAYIYLTMKDLAAFDHMKGDTEGFVNMPLSIKDILFSVLFIEKEKFIKLSFRSKGDFPVNKFAAEFFSGGGHLNASGGEYNDNLENTIAYFLKVLKENFIRFNNKI
ncbi:MAG: bifunctional oligoribonuclease/PAP phosphatase NrnA [Bacteroidales bacterium]|nr:bifunctional oligoribonuclease/PAP phosphatase NrnA [Bacteroidales bacterium]